MQQKQKVNWSKVSRGVLVVLPFVIVGSYFICKQLTSTVCFDLEQAQNGELEIARNPNITYGSDCK